MIEKHEILEKMNNAILEEFRRQRETAFERLGLMAAELAKEKAINEALKKQMEAAKEELENLNEKMAKLQGKDTLDGELIEGSTDAGIGTGTDTEPQQKQKRGREKA